MEGPPLGPGGEDITWPDQVAPRGQKASGTRKIKPQTSNLKCLRRRGGSGTYHLRESYEGHTPRRKLTASLSGKGAAKLPGIPILQSPIRGTRVPTGSPHRATPSPCQRARMCYAEPSSPRQAERPGSRGRTALTMLTAKLSTATRARQPHGPQHTARYGARQAGRHEHEHCTTKPEQHPGSLMGSTGTHQRGPTGPCHRRGVYL